MVPSKECLLIENVAVDPAHQGKGLGHVLMAHVEKTARELGFATVRLYTNKLFAANLSFYSVLGYRIDREEAFKGGFLVHFSKPVVP